MKVADNEITIDSSLVQTANIETESKSPSSEDLRFDDPLIDDQPVPEEVPELTIEEEMLLLKQTTAAENSLGDIVNLGVSEFNNQFAEYRELNEAQKTNLDTMLEGMRTEIMTTQITPDNIIEWVNSLEGLGEAENTVFYNAIIEMLKDEYIPGYDIIRNVDELLYIYEAAKYVKQFLDDNPEIASLTSILEDGKIQENKYDMYGSPTSISWESSKFNEIIMFYLHPEWYGDSSGVRLDTHPLNLDGWEGIGQVFKSFVPGVTTATEEMAQAGTVASVLQDIINDLSATGSYSNLGELLLENIKNATMFINMAYEEGKVSAKIDTPGVTGILISSILTMANEALSSTQINKYLFKLNEYKLMSSITDLVMYMIPYAGIGFLANNILSNGLISSREDPFIKPTNLDLLMPQLNKLPGTIQKDTVEGLKLSYNPLFGNYVFIYNDDLQKQGLIMELKGTDVSNITRAIGKLPIAGKVFSAIKIVSLLTGLTSDNIDQYYQFENADFASLVLPPRDIFQIPLVKAATSYISTKLLEDAYLKITGSDKTTEVIFDAGLLGQVLSTESTIIVNETLDAADLIPDAIVSVDDGLDKLATLISTGVITVIDTVDVNAVVGALNGTLDIATDEIKAFVDDATDIILDELVTLDDTITTTTDKILDDITTVLDLEITDLDIITEIIDDTLDTITTVSDIITIINDAVTDDILTVTSEGSSQDDTSQEDTTEGVVVSTVDGVDQRVLTKLAKLYVSPKIDDHITENVEAEETVQEEPDLKWKNYY